mmetsp:Transcript_16288/g.52125  ORF Transcript_16288/g.52125 Transcript_16288/m.52125 type:complete len:428 (+) Transcript_16288:199-1482(+)
MEGTDVAMEEGPQAAQPKLSADVRIYGLAGLLCTVTLDRSSTASTAKHSIGGITGIPFDEMTLVAGERLLRDDEPLPAEVFCIARGRGLTLVRQQPDYSDLLDAPSAVRSDKSKVLAAVERNGMTLRYADAGLRADREVVLAAVKQEGVALQYASSSLCADKEVVLAAVRQAGWALRFASPQLRDDKEVVLEAVRQAGWALCDASPELRRDAGVVSTAVQRTSLASCFALDPMHCSSEELDAEQETVLDRGLGPRPVRRCVPKSVPVEQRTEVAEGEDWLLALAGGGKDRVKVLAALRRCGLALSRAPAEFRADREVVLVAVARHGEALQFAAPELKSDRGVVLAAVRQAGWALQHAALSLQADREIVLAAVQESGWALEFAAPTLRADREVVRTAARRDGLALRFAVRELHDDPELVAAADWQQRR